MPKAYYITNWDTDRENAETRKYVDLLWFRNKVKLMGEGLGHTLAAPNNRGPHLYGMFKLIEQVAAGGRLEQRGWLFRNGSPMDAQRIANLLRLPVADVEEALQFFSTPPMNWLEQREYPGDSPGKTGTPPNGGRTPGDSPGKTQEGDKRQERPGRNAASEEHPNQPTVVQRPKNPEEERERAGPSASEIQASRTRAGALLAQIREMEARKTSLTPEERADLRKKRRTLAALQEKQAAGDFTTQTT